jgi:transcriptional regulator of acetoin/glycerol metabolism
MAEFKQCENKQSSITRSLFSNPAHEARTMSLMEWELHGIKTALKNCGGNISLAAKTLGITRATLYKKIDRFGLNKIDGSLLYTVN